MVTWTVRSSLLTAANAIAWLVIAGMIGVAFVLVVILGAFGLILLGLCTVFVCTSFNLRDDIPTYSEVVFRAQSEGRWSPEQKAAMFAEKERSLAPVRFYRWCGIILIIAGIAGFVWQQVWQGQ